MIEPDALCSRVGAVDPGPKSETVNLNVRVVLSREVTDQSDNERRPLPLIRWRSTPSQTFFPFYFFSNSPAGTLTAAFCGGCRCRLYGRRDGLATVRRCLYPASTCEVRSTGSATSGVVLIRAADGQGFFPRTECLTLNSPPRPAFLRAQYHGCHNLALPASLSTSHWHMVAVVNCFEGFDVVRKSVKYYSLHHHFILLLTASDVIEVYETS